MFYDIKYIIFFGDCQIFLSDDHFNLLNETINNNNNAESTKIYYIDIPGNLKWPVILGIQYMISSASLA